MFACIVVIIDDNGSTWDSTVQVISKALVIWRINEEEPYIVQIHTLDTFNLREYIISRFYHFPSYRENIKSQIVIIVSYSLHMSEKIAFY